LVQAMWRASPCGQPTLLPSNKQHSLRGGSNSKGLLSALTIPIAPPQEEQKRT
jgi:hypothetical protein